MTSLSLRDVANTIETGVWLAYAIIGTLLTRRATRYLKDRDKPRYYTVLYDVEEFTLEGDGPRRRALAFWWIGAILIVLWYAIT